MPSGRPSSYTDQVADEICLRISEGQSLNSICQSEGMPILRTVLNWLSKPEHVSFLSRYARARMQQADVMDGLILDVASRVLSGDIDPRAGDVVMKAYQWRAGRLDPKRYGDRIENRLADPDGNALKITVTGIRPTDDNT